MIGREDRVHHVKGLVLLLAIEEIAFAAFRNVGRQEVSGRAPKYGFVDEEFRVMLRRNGGQQLEDPIVEERNPAFDSMCRGGAILMPEVRIEVLSPMSCVKIPGDVCIFRLRWPTQTGLIEHSGKHQVGVGVGESGQTRRSHGGNRLQPLAEFAPVIGRPRRLRAQRIGDITPIEFVRSLPKQNDLERRVALLRKFMEMKFEELFRSHGEHFTGPENPAPVVWRQTYVCLVEEDLVIGETEADCDFAAGLGVTTAEAMPGAACPGFYINREPFLDVIRMHRASVNNINKSHVPPALLEASKQCWDEALANGEKHGYRNAQVTVLAPTGTIGFMMDCDTTGIEPDLALIKYKKLVGGGMIKIVNNTVPGALFKLGYTHEQADAIVSYVDATGTIEGAPHIKDEHLAVFDCSFKPAKGTRSIHYMGHIKMMAAAQPFISGAISKTVNLPNSATAEDIMEAYTQSWKLGVKAVAIYRDGCKQSQPLSAAGTKTALSGKEEQRTGVSAPQIEEVNLNAPPHAIRHRLKEERMSVTHKFNIGGHEGYLIVGLYPDGEPGEIFIKMAKEGSTVSGLMDSFALAVSIALQHGVPLKMFCEKFAHTRFEPSGWSNNPDIGFAKSIMDYIFRWLQLRFLSGQQQMLFENLRPRALGAPAPEVGDLNGSVGSAADSLRTENRELRTGSGSVHAADALASLVDMGDAPSCSFCGSIMTRNGSCYRCMSCGSTSGCS